MSGAPGRYPSRHLQRFRMAEDVSSTRQTFQEAMELIVLPSSTDTKRYMGTRAAWLPGSDLPLHQDLIGRGRAMRSVPHAAFGGHVYSQAGLAVCRAVEDEEKRRGMKSAKRLGLHTLHGYFTAAGLPDRPFVYEVSFHSNGRSFTTAQVIARQPTSASKTSDHFPPSDASQPLGPVVFTAIVSLTLPQPPNTNLLTQQASVQSRFSAILSTRAPMDWPPAPTLDLDPLLMVVGRDIVGTFPIVHMRKVDLRAWNEGRPHNDRRELILYRLLAPLPTCNDDGSSNGWGANSHVLAHAYEADRNGLLMVANHLCDGWSERVASLSYSFMVHVNVDDAVMEYGEDQWWVQEWGFTVSGVGRATIVSKIWSPKGVHVATKYQDGLSTPRKQFKL